MLIIGLPIAPILAWYHGIQRLKRVSIPELILIVLLLVIGGTLLWRSPQPDVEHRAAEAVKPVSVPPVQPIASAVAFAPPAHSIAVLPFVNMSGDAKQEYFSDGISEELLNALSRLNELQVAARTSSFSFKGQNVDVSTIAHKLNVGTILEGSVRRAGKTVRITVQLIDAVSGFHIWSETYDRTLNDTLKIQTEVATSVAEKLKIQMSTYGHEQLALGSTNNAEAYDAYLRGVQLDEKGYIEQSAAVARSSLAELERSVSLDPKFAQAYARRADVLRRVAGWENDQNAREVEQAQALKSAEQAVALAPTLGEAHLSLGSTRLVVLLDIAGAAPEFDRALFLAPGSARVLAGFANFAYALRHFDSAVNAARRAVILDPQNISAHTDLAGILTDARRFDEARVALQDASILDPASRLVAGTKANLLLASGQVDSAVKHCESRDTPLAQWARSACLALAYHASGRQSEAERELEKFQSIEGNSFAYFYAGTYAQWGNLTAALKWLSTAERQRDPDLMWLKVSWEFDPIQNNPEFRAIEDRLKFPQ
jgi:TolB-like protein/Tfp pilus assembly protein PilF